jgi:MFS transporter, AAHS family, 4-hydroxybenzoate transporter
MNNTSTQVDIPRLLNEQPFSAYQWLVFWLCFLVVLFDGFDTAAIGYIAPSLMAEWNVGKPDLGPVLSAALVGLTAGAVVAGPLADRLGRKIVLATSVLLFGVACLLSASADGLQQLTIFRFVTGLGLGAAMPNAVTLTSEYCPNRRRALLTNAMFCAFPLGAALGGFLASAIIPLWGWRAVLVLGGSLPLLLAILLFAFLPESLRYLVAKRAPAEKIRRVLARVAPGLASGAEFVSQEEESPTGRKGSLGIIFSRAYVIGTLALWVTYFMGLVIFYALINWMPILLRDAGIAARDAALIAALFPLGGVGSIFFGWLMDRFNANRVLAVGFAITAVAVFAIGQVGNTVGVLVVVVFAAGAIMNTSQSSLPSLAAGFYPTEGRATGVAWMLGAGRFGGIVGSLLVGELMRRQFGFSEIFTILAVPGLLAATALLVKQGAHPETSAEHGATIIEAHVHAEELNNV